MHLARKNMLEAIKCHFLRKKLSKEVMTRSRLGNNYLKNKNEENKTLNR